MDSRIILFVLLILAGCAAPKTASHRAILNWQAEGRYIYRTTDEAQYFVECEHGLKYIGRVGGERTGPVDTCTGEEK